MDPNVGFNSPPWPPFTARVVFVKFPKLVHWCASNVGVNSPPWTPFTTTFFFKFLKLVR